ncbi:YggT family protein [Nocardia huaxiensis]|uniref:YggT family protein n=1 Tax=Nocardia huaxiensis TaxID=2755382 RepID=A0A7D6ZUI2_9NOCA|nr:YggT family protein [Nocardia huaxiensis]QLY29009.1 YggT family protein [Nocardia huaxiensis]UFS97508.1 YggT family protein [Nocardia huaxiensis]
MGIIWTLLSLVVSVFILIMLARLVVDWITALSRDPAPWVGKVREGTYKLTEPVIAPVRKVLPPINFGSVGIDLAFTVVFILALVLRTVLLSL